MKPEPIAMLFLVIIIAIQTARLYSIENHYQRIIDYKADRIYYYKNKIAENNERAELLKRNSLKDSEDYRNGERYHDILKAKLEANEYIPT